MKKGMGRVISLALLGLLLSPVHGWGESPQKKENRDQGPSRSQPLQMNLLQSRVSLVMETEKATAFLYEMILVSIKIRVHRFSIKDIQYPRFPHEAFIQSKFDDPIFKEETIDGLKYETVEFKALFFATQTGNFTLGPAQLQCSLQEEKAEGQSPLASSRGDVREDFFGAREIYPVTLKSKTVPLSILALPEKGKPPDFNDAVGNFRFRLDVQPRAVRAGDPINLKMVINGEGNFAPIKPPQMGEKAGFRVYEAQARQEKSSKIFEQVIIPQTEALHEIPELRFSYFDPQEKRYLTLVQGPVALKVNRPDPADDLKNRGNSPPDLNRGEREPSGKDILPIKKSPGRLSPRGKFLFSNKNFLLLQGIPLLFLMVIFAFHRQRERLRHDKIYAAQRRAAKRIKEGLKRTSRAFKEGKSEEFYDCLFKTLQAYLMDKFNVSPGEIAPERIGPLLETKNDFETWQGKLEKILEQCSLARYASVKYGAGEMEKTWEDFRDIIGHLQREKGRG